jgi:hypothetical protein
VKRGASNSLLHRQRTAPVDIALSLEWSAAELHAVVRHVFRMDTDVEVWESMVCGVVRVVWLIVIHAFFLVAA